MGTVRTADPKTHDYTVRSWGHDYIFEPLDDGVRGRMQGWGRGITPGDYLLLQHGNGSTRYRVKDIEYKADPPDMWFATVVFTPRMHEGSGS
jgi:hypothetical protein